MTRYPTTTRANLRQSPSSSPEALSGTQPLTDITNSADYHGSQDSFRDILDNKPVLSVGTLNIRDESNENYHADHDTSDNTSTTATFAGHGNDDSEEGTGDHSSDSNGSPTSSAARFGRSPRRGSTSRPRSYILRDEPYVGLTDIRDTRATNPNHACRVCRNGSRCWCPIRESPNTNGRGPRSRRLDRCGSCGKMYVILGTSRQWCCHGWIPRSSGSPPLDR